MSRKATWIIVGLVLISLLLLGGVTTIIPKIIESVTEKKKLDALQPHVRDAVVNLRERLLGLGIKTLVGSTRRTDDEQASKVASGNSATQNSFHLLGLAIDLYPYDPDTDKPDLNGKHVDLFKVMHNESKQFGFSGLAFNSDGSKRYITTKKDGKSVKVWDAGHLELTGGLTFAQNKAKYSGIA